MAEPKPENEKVCFCTFPFKNLFNSEEMSDCCFIFTNENAVEKEDGDETLHKIHAHKLILANCSPVFKVMLYGPMAESKITITDISSKVFLALFKYIYTGEEILDDENLLMGLLKAVDKYDISQFLEVVEEKIIKNLSIDNVLEVYEFVGQFQNSKLEKEIVLFIKRNTMSILQHENFTQVQRSTLNFVLSLDNLNATEIQLFNACLRWAKMECCIENPSPAELRAALGQELFLIRIATMDAKNFLQGPVASGILEIKEQKELIDYITSSVKPKETASDFVSSFNLIGRQFQKSFQLMLDSEIKFISSTYSTKEVTTTLQFKTSADVLLMEFNFCHILNPFTVTSVILLEESTPVVVKGQFDHSTIKEKDGKESTSHSISFDSPLLIQAGLTYKLSMCLEFDRVRHFTRAIDSETMTKAYDRKLFEKNPISIEFFNRLHSDIYIYSLSVY